MDRYQIETFYIWGHSFKVNDTFFFSGNRDVVAQETGEERVIVVCCCCKHYPTDIILLCSKAMEFGLLYASIYLDIIECTPGLLKLCFW